MSKKFNMPVGVIHAIFKNRENLMNINPAQMNKQRVKSRPYSEIDVKVYE